MKKQIKQVRNLALLPIFIPVAMGGLTLVGLGLLTVGVGAGMMYTVTQLEEITRIK